MSARSAGLSCDTCHPDGRDDGIVWQSWDLPRQTRSLTPDIADTAPYSWLGETASLEQEVATATTDRMSGTGPSRAERDTIVSALRAFRGPVRPHLPPEAIARGRRLFFRPDVGCASCHSGPSFTDGNAWFVLSFAKKTNTPSLRGIGSSAPYLHDGSYDTLPALLNRTRDGSMGDTSTLTDQEMDDLVTFLMSL